MSSMGELDKAQPHRASVFIPILVMKRRCSVARRLPQSAWQRQPGLRRQVSLAGVPALRSRPHTSPGTSLCSQPSFLRCRPSGGTVTLPLMGL